MTLDSSTLAPPQVVSGFHGQDVPSYDIITNCMHCGLCLPHCPTFALTGLEKSSPRGRIRLMKAVTEGDLAITDGFIDEMNFCLDCQACETVCPAGIKYGSLVEAARAQIFAGKYEPFLSRLTQHILLDWFFSRQKRLKVLAMFLRLYERSGLQWFFQKSRILKLVSRKLHEVQFLSPRISDKFSSDVLAETISPKEKPRYRVAFLTGCIMDVAFSDVNMDTIQLLLMHGCEVKVPKEQGCCGSLQAHYGDRVAARRMARRTIEAFSDPSIDFIVMNSAGCGAFMKEYAHLFEGDSEFATLAARVSQKTVDITEFLASIGLRVPKNQNRFLKSVAGKRVTYHDACHLVHTQRISREPRTLLQSIPGIEFVELPESSWCCGSAGIYNIVRHDDAMKLLDRKVHHVESVSPDILVTGNPGCMVQIQHGLEKHGLPVSIMHTATFLRKACEANEA
ncbi:MAG: glcF [Bacteroidetes bacterium]|nr:glcF [Bacteroidota bacterium]